MKRLIGLGVVWKVRVLWKDVGFRWLVAWGFRNGRFFIEPGKVKVGTVECSADWHVIVEVWPARTAFVCVTPLRSRCFYNSIFAS